jgi:hypothetical protein
MNTLATASMTDPYGKVSECIQFTIVDPSSPFVLNDIMAVGRQYTFSLWLMSEADASLMVAGKTFISTNVWNKHSVTFTADDTGLYLNFGVAGTYCIYHPQLEIGDKATDWTPAPEDQSEAMETRFTVEAGKVEAQFTVVNESIDALGKVVEEKYSKTITENENGISIGDSDGIYEIQVDNVEGVTIRKNGEVRSQLVDDDFFTGNMVVKVNERAQFGNFAFVPRSDGSLSFLKVGG